MVATPDRVDDAVRDDPCSRRLTEVSLSWVSGRCSPGDLLPAPRAFAERVFDVQEWVDEPERGHVAACGRPQAHAAGVHRTPALAR